MTNITIKETKFINEVTPGGNWSTVKKELETQEVTKEYYENTLTWKPEGERRYSSHTPLGYVVTKITTPSPLGDYRIVRKYDIKVENN